MDIYRGRYPKAGPLEASVKTRLLLQLEKWFSYDEEYFFMHNSASWHKARSVTAHLAEINVAISPWSGNSLGKNPIESFWDLTQRAIGKGVSTAKRQLNETVFKEWYHNLELQQKAAQRAHCFVISIRHSLN